jgi:hypothetical protein
MDKESLMSALDRTPQNTNYLQPTKFLLTFDRIPDTQYFCQSFNLPGLKLGRAQYDTPFRGIPIAGTKLEYNTLNMTFNVNGDIASWMNLHQWMRSIGSPVGFDDRNNLTQQQTQRTSLKAYTDATLTVLSNLNNPVTRFYFYNIYPTSLSDIDFDTTKSADDVIIGNSTFEFEYYDMMPV